MWRCQGVNRIALNEMLPFTASIVSTLTQYCHSKYSESKMGRTQLSKRGAEFLFNCKHISGVRNIQLISSSSVYLFYTQ